MDGLVNLCMDREIHKIDSKTNKRMERPMDAKQRRHLLPDYTVYYGED